MNSAPETSRRPSRREFVTAAAAGTAALAISPVLAAGDRASAKKGFCTLIRDDGKWLKQIQALRAKWLYSWGANVPDNLPQGVDFSPMIWGFYGDKTQPTLDRIKQTKRDRRLKHLLGFNEPDQHDQSNLTVEQALDAWPKLMEVGLPLGSPGCVHADRQWMIDFMRGVEERRLRVDFVCVHSYGGPNAQALLARLQRIHQAYGRPIWITEFAVGDWEAKSAEKNRHRPQRVAQFMREALPLLERAGFVHRYAWYSASPTSSALGTSALFDSSGELTELGKIYQAF